jgi:hypothetical protein
MQTARPLALLLATASLAVALDACGEDGPGAASSPDAGSASVDASAATTNGDGGSPLADAVAPPLDAPADTTEAGKVLADGLVDPVPYKSRVDSPLYGVVLATYDHFEDWEDGVVNTPGVTPSSTALGSAYGAALIDSVDGDDGAVDGKCEKDGGTCNSGFANGIMEFTFDATVLGALPTHVGVAWTDGSTGADAVFEAFDANDVSLGTKTAAAVADGSNQGTVDEDRYFVVVHTAGVKKVVVKSTSGGVEVDHLHYGR